MSFFLLVPFRWLLKFSSYQIYQMCQKRVYKLVSTSLFLLSKPKGMGKAMLVRLVRAARKEGKSYGDGPCMFAWKGRP